MALAACLLGSAAGAATLPAGFSESAVAPTSSLPSGTAMQFAPDGRLFVTLQTGQVRVIKNGALLATPFASLSVDAQGERGLLGIAFDPNFAANNYVYLYYTVPGSPPHNRVSRFTANGDVVAVGSELPILDLENLGATNHNGGALSFGPDGKLYVAVGENASGSNAQSLTNRLGKLLRINTDGSIPTDNPTTFAGVAGSPTGLNRAIWALGLRNPYTFAFNPGGPAPSLLINDVGQSTWEEIDDGIAGANYGWPNSEGGEPANVNYVGPRYRYGHGSTATTGCAITGGTFYNPAAQTFPAEYLNDYFFADYCTGWIRRLDTATNTVVGFATGAGSPVDLRVSSAGDLYYLSRGAGTVYRVRYTGGATSVRLTLATSPAGLQVRLDGAVVSTPLSFDSLTGTAHVIEAFPQTAAGQAYVFAGWSDGGGAAHTIVTPSANTTYTATFLTGPPAVPTGLTAVINGGTLSLSWGRSPGAVGYRLEGGSAAGQANLGVLDLGDVSSIEAQVPPGVYYLRVRALTAAGASGPSNEVVATVSSTAACTTAPPTPTGYAGQVNGLFVALSWNASPAATSYVVEAGTASGAANLGAVAVGAVTSVQNTVGAGTYFTRVRAVNACGVSAPSADVSVAPSCARVTAPSGLAVVSGGGVATVSWLPVLGATSYRVLAGTAPSLTDIGQVTVGLATTLPIPLAGVPAGAYYLRVVAVTACGVTAPTNEVTLVVP